MECITLAQGRETRWIVLNLVMNIRASSDTENFLISLDMLAS